MKDQSLFGGKKNKKKISSIFHLLNLPRESLVKVFSINPEFIIGIFFFFFFFFLSYIKCWEKVIFSTGKVNFQY